MEEKLYTNFITTQAQGKPVGQRWLIREGKKIMNQNQENTNPECKFSDGWFQGFCKRWNVAWRVRTKVSQEAPTEKDIVIQSFLQEVRRKSQPYLPLSLRTSFNLHTRFPLQYIYNMDQTSLPFEFLQTRTFDKKGATTIYIHSAHTAWTKRQATLMLTTCANRELRGKPILIFHGDGGLEEKRPRRLERLQYHNGVRVFFNRTAYSNEEITLNWIHFDLCHMQAQDTLELPQPERLIILDVLPGQKTAKVLSHMKECHLVPVYVPNGCTGYVQPMDTAIKELVKDKIALILKETLDMEEVVTHHTVGQ